VPVECGRVNLTNSIGHHKGDAVFEIYKDFFNWTVVTAGLTGTNNILSWLIVIPINTAFRAGIIYCGIRLVMTALSHGSF
jgi:hypothetical protein